MTKIIDNLVTEGFSGKMGRQLVFRNVKGQTFAARRPKSRQKRKKTETQLGLEMRFRKAVLYAKSILTDETIKAEYAEKAMNSPKKVSAYNLAMADYLNAPEISIIDLSNYAGNSGEMITVTAIDDFKVKSVSVEIVQSDDTPVEKGDAVQSLNGLEWEYTTQSANALPAGSKVIVRAADLPGNVTLKETVI